MCLTHHGDNPPDKFEVHQVIWIHRRCCENQYRTSHESSSEKKDDIFFSLTSKTTIQKMASSDGQCAINYCTWIYLQCVVVIVCIFKEAIHGIENLVWQKEEPFPIKRNTTWKYEREYSSRNTPKFPMLPPYENWGWFPLGNITLNIRTCRRQSDGSRISLIKTVKRFVM